MDRRVRDSNTAFNHPDPRTSAPDFLHHYLSNPPSPSFPMSPPEDWPDAPEDLETLDADMDSVHDDFLHDVDALSKMDVQSLTTSQYDALIESELERKWILNLSMYFRDKSKREKFFVTFRQHEHHWRRVTVSLDYRNAPESSLEADLAGTQYQRDKSAKIYEAIRDSLAEIDFYSTVTNLKLETKEGRLHVHVVEDVNVCRASLLPVNPC
jgi:DNA relaxase NicK